VIISYKHKFIFIRVPKTASTSIQLALGKICGPYDIVTAFTGPPSWTLDHNPRNDEKYKPHTAAIKIKETVSPEIWNSYFKFAFERNPFDKVVSTWDYRLHWKHDHKSFKQFCKEVSQGSGVFTNASELYTIGNKVVVDFIGKYENLEEDFNFVCKKLNLPEIELTRERVGSRQEKDYRKYYDDETKRIVEEYYAREIELFNYKF